MKSKKRIIITFLIITTIFSAYSDFSRAADIKRGDYIKWINFDIPCQAMKEAMEVDIKTHNDEYPVNWIRLLAYLSAKYWGDWDRYRSADIDKVQEQIKKGETIETLSEGMEYYHFYYEAYYAVLYNFVGEYEIKVPKEYGGSGAFEKKYGLKAFSPIAKGYYFAHCDDFGNARSYGYYRKHLGNDLMGSAGSPIVAVESGVVEALGWNRYGGWRIGIRSFDGKRYYYYAHLRKNWPYVKALKQGQTVKAGDVIGYMGRTGYSFNENANNINTTHLHFGMQIIFNEAQKDGINQIWIDVYDIVNFLESNKTAVKEDSAGEFGRVNEFIDTRYEDKFK